MKKELFKKRDVKKNKQKQKAFFCIGLILYRLNKIGPNLGVDRIYKIQKG